MNISFPDTKQGFFLEFAPHANSRNGPGHLFCGPNDLYGGLCPNCEKPLLRFLSLDLRDKILGIHSEEIRKAPFLFCWTCNIAQGDFFYRIRDDEKIEILKCVSGGQTDDFPYPEYPLFFPEQRVYPHVISNEIQEMIAKVNRRQVDQYDLPEKFDCFFRPRHQIGGEPFLLQFPLKAQICLICGKPMEFVLTIGNETGSEKKFTTNNYVQVLFSFCGSCCVIGAYQQCD